MHSSVDDDHLQLLSIFHYIEGCLVGLFSLFPLIHVAIGIGIINGAFDNVGKGEPPPEWFGWLFVLIPLVFIVTGLSMAVCILFVGRNLAQRKSHLFCIVVAGIECLFMPFGTVLGVFTIVVLQRPSVKQQFGIDGYLDEDDIDVY